MLVIDSVAVGVIVRCTLVLGVHHSCSLFVVVVVTRVEMKVFDLRWVDHKDL